MRKSSVRTLDLSVLLRAMQALTECGGVALLILDLLARREWVGGQHHSPAVPPENRFSPPCTGGWVSLGAGLDVCGKSRPWHFAVATKLSGHWVLDLAQRHFEMELHGNGANLLISWL